jgi:hypothetical protein
METERKATEVRAPAIDLLANLKVAVAQLRLYPPHSPQVLKVATAAYQSVSGFLNDSGTLTLSRSPRGLLVNGKRVPVLGEVANSLEAATLALLQEVQIKTISFRKGLTLEELVSFLHALVRKFWDVKDGKEINKRLRDARVFQVTVDEVEYVAVGAGDLVLEDAAAKLEGTNARVAEIMKTLDSIIETAVADGVGDQLRLEIMKKLIDQDPALIQKAQASGMAGAGQGDAPGWITFEQARQALGDIVRVMQKAEGEPREVLRKLGHTVVGGFRHDPVVMALMKKFLSDEASELFPAWLKDGGEAAPSAPSPGGAAVRRAGAILALQEEDQIPALQQEAAALVRELSALQDFDLAAELLVALAGFVRHTVAERRTAAAETLLGILPLLGAPGLADSRRQVEDRSRSALNLERDSRVYPKLADLAAALVDDLLRRGEFDRALAFLQVLQRHYQVKESSFPQRVELAFRALDRIATGPGFPAVIEKLRAREPVAVALVEALDLAAARSLISEMKRIENAPDRLAVAQLLLKVGAGAGTLLIEETQKATAPSEALRLAEVVPHAVSESMAEMALAGLLRHPAAVVRHRAAALLAERAYGRAGTLLLDALREERDPAGRAGLIDALRQVRHGPALGMLCEIVDSRSETEDVRVAACHALGRIERPESVPILAKVVKSGRGLTKLLNPAGPAVRAAAAMALASFARNAEAREALKLATEDPDGAVQNAARGILYAPLIKAFGEITQEVRLVTSVQEAEKEQSGLAGSLAELPLDQICQLLETSKKSGALVLNYGGAVARVFFEDGLVATADFEGRQDQEAFNDFCAREGGFFLFQPGAAPPRRTLQEGVKKLLLEAHRLGDEARRARAGS